MDSARDNGRYNRSALVLLYSHAAVALLLHENISSEGEYYISACFIQYSQQPLGHIIMGAEGIKH